MSNNIIVVLTEGDHDSAFLSRILKASDFTSYTNIIKDFPEPLNEFLKTDILKISIEEVKIEEARRTRFLPSYVLQGLEGQECLILIYSVGGDSKDEIRIELTKTLNSFNDPDPTAIQPFGDINFSVLYFFDADENGVEPRCNQIKDELEKSFDANLIPEVIESGKNYIINRLTIGAYIFVDANTGTGKLEDILIPLMKDNNEDVFEAAEKFLGIHETTHLFAGKIKYAENGKIHKVNGEKFDLKKSLIGTVGQLQKSGKSNTVCISDADYLNKTKIAKSQVCGEIIKFIQSFIK